MQRVGLHAGRLLVSRVRDFILFHNKRHPADLGLREATHFLEHVVNTAADALPAQARAALTLLYEGVLGNDLEELPQPRPPHLVECGTNIRTVQLLLGHESLETTMIYTHVARKGVTGVTSPLDLLDGFAG